MKIIYFGNIENGLLKIRNRKAFDNEIKSFEGKEVCISVERKKKKRSSEQNRYYHGCVVPIVKQGLIDLGNEVNAEVTHEFLKANFCRKEIINPETGEVKILPQSTTELTATQFMEFIDKIQQWASEWLGVYIPNPNEQVGIEFESA